MPYMPKETENDSQVIYGIYSNVTKKFLMVTLNYEEAEFEYTMGSYQDQKCELVEFSIVPKS